MRVSHVFFWLGVQRARPEKKNILSSVENWVKKKWGITRLPREALTCCHNDVKYSSMRTHTYNSTYGSKYSGSAKEAEEKRIYTTYYIYYHIYHYTCVSSWQLANAKEEETREVLIPFILQKKKFEKFIRKKNLTALHSPPPVFARL
jgi:hypothetical protein